MPSQPWTNFWPPTILGHCWLLLRGFAGLAIIRRPEGTLNEPPNCTPTIRNSGLRVRVFILTKVILMRPRKVPPRLKYCLAVRFSDACLPHRQQPLLGPSNRRSTGLGPSSGRKDFENDARHFEATVGILAISVRNFGPRYLPQGLIKLRDLLKKRLDEEIIGRILTDFLNECIKDGFCGVSRGLGDGLGEPLFFSRGPP